MKNCSEEFTISPIEIKRRETAYATLVVSLTISISAMFLIWVKNWTMLIHIIPLVSLFFISIFIFKKFFKNYAKTKINLTDEFIERISHKATEKIFFQDIKSITVRYTTRKDVRDIIITGKDKTLALDGLENFHQFKDALLSRTKVPAKESHEHLDYDHPFFYAILGILVGFILPYGIMYFAKKSTSWVTSAIAIYAALVGLFFVINHPMAKRYGDKKPLADIIFGTVLFIAGIAIYYFI